MKQDLIEALAAALPAGIRSLKQTTIGDMTEVSIPTTTDAANIVMGDVTAQLFNAVFVPLSGLSIVDLALHIGSANPVNIASLLASLEYCRTPGKIEFLAPLEGGVYAGYFDEWIVKGDGDSMTVTVDGEDFDLDDNGDGTWGATWPVALGDHSATASNGQDEAYVSFSVVSFATVPEEGDVLPSTGIAAVSVTPEDVEVSSVSVTVTDALGGIFSASLEITENSFSIDWDTLFSNGTLAIGPASFVFSATLDLGLVEIPINVVITE